MDSVARPNRATNRYLGGTARPIGAVLAALLAMGGLTGVPAYADDGISSDARTGQEESVVISGVTPVITGSVEAGSTLVVNPGEWSPLETELSYQWLRDGADIAGASSPEYTVTADDIGAAISVAVTGSLTGAEPVSYTSAATSVVGPLTLATSTPQISGAARVGALLTVDPGVWTDGASFTYQWFRSGVAISGATNTGYTPTVNDLGHTVVVVVTGTLFGYDSASIQSMPTTAISPGDLKSATPSISGEVKVDHVLTANPGGWTAGTQFVYQWYADGAAISNATSKTLTLKAAHAGTRISLKVTGTLNGYSAKTATSASTIKVANGTLTAGTPQITGTTKVEKTLTAKPGQWSSGTTFTYQWYRDGAKITNATSSTYVLTGTDAGKKITVRVTGTKAGYATLASTSAATAKIANGTLKGGTLKLSGTIKVGSKLSVSAGTWTSGTKLTYQWYRNGSKISQATASSYTLTAADSGKEISVKVTGSKTGYDKATKSVAKTWALAKKTPSISGTPTVGKALTAVPGSWTSGTTFTYQWYRNGVAISNAKAATYKLTATDAGKQFSVKVTGVKQGYTTASMVSGQTAKVARASLSMSTPTISGSATAGRTLTANPGTWTTGTTFAYQWYRNGTAISGATKSTYKTGGKDPDKGITVKVTGSKAGYKPSSKTSSATVIKMSATQMAAVDLGNRYLRYLSFSRAGLIGQLEYEGYATADATVAVDYISPNWKSEARESAASYLRSMSFSRAGLIDQLLYEGFTQSEATYGVDSQNADWHHQAFLEAQSYMRVFPYWSYSELYGQLLYEKFTPAQAAYGADSYFGR